MRSRQQIIAWREHAAWSTDAQVEQDLLITEAMVAIFQDPFLSSQVAMRGGTVLHKVHLAPATRYSEDIDLVLVGDRPIDHIDKALKRALKPVLGTPTRTFWKDIRLAVRNVIKPSKVFAAYFEFQPTFQPRPARTIKVEINYTEREPCYAIVDLPYQPPVTGLSAPVILRSYDLDEMLGTKMRALLQRNFGRDLFDLDQALTRNASLLVGGEAAILDPVRIAAAFANYMARENAVVTRAAYEAALAQKLATPAFRNDMSLVLPAGVGFDPVQAGANFKAAILSHLA
jgi:hypothetical protein